jgi:hypothetical protein
LSTEGFAPDVQETFGGLCTLIDRSELPKGASPDAENVAFIPGTVRSRDGYAVQLTNTSGVQNIASFVTSGIRRLLALYKDGTLRQEYPEGTETNVISSYGQNQIMKAVTLYGRKYMAFSDGKVPTSPALVWDGTTLSRLSRPGPPYRYINNPSVALSGNNASYFTGGYRSLFLANYMSTGYMTRPMALRTNGMLGSSPQKKINITGIPLGPTGTVSRYIFMTLSETLTVGNVYLGAPMYCYTPTMVIGDNTTTSLSDLDVSETMLANGIEGSSLWNKQILAPAIGLCSFGGRLVAWGALADQMEIGQGTTGNLGAANSLYFDSPLDGTVPSGWWGVTSGVTVVSTAGGVGTVCKITGAGSSAFTMSSSLFPMGTLGTGLMPGKRYGLRLRMRRDSSLTSGTLKVWLPTYSIASPYLVLSNIAVTSIGTDFAEYTFPPYAAMSSDGGSGWVYLSDSGGIFNTGGILYIDEIALVPEDAGDLRSTGWASVDGPEDFDRTRSPFQVSPGDGQALMSCFQLAGTYYGAKEHSLWATAENGSDPVTWVWQKVSDVCGAASVHAVGWGNRFVILACRSGVYYFDGGQPQKISQDIERGLDPTALTWRSIDWTQAHLIWVTVDPERMQFRIGAPTDPTVAGCNKIFVADYVEGFSSGSIIAGGAYQTAEGARGLKWSVDTIMATCGEQAERDDRSSTQFIGGKLTASNDVPTSGSFAFPSPWTTVGTNPTVTAGQVDALGGTSASRLQFVAGTNRITQLLSTTPASGAYYTVTIRLKLNVGTTLSAILKSPGAAFGSDVPITITSAWQRFTATFGPMNGATAERIIIDLGSGTPDVLIGSAQIQAGQYDFGECVTTGSPVASADSGFIAKPVLAQTYDFFGPVNGVYTTSPFCEPIGRSTFSKIAVRAMGLGQLVTKWVRPDGSTSNLRGGQYPTLTTAPMYDYELDSNEQASMLNVRFSSDGAKTSWWAVHRVGVLRKMAEFAAFRGRG